MSHSQPDVLEVIEFRPDEVIRVLEVRPRVRTPLPSPAPTTPAPSVAPVAAASPTRPTIAAPSAKAAPATRVPAPRKHERSLEETLDDLQTYAVSLNDDDGGSTTGVRHLHVDIEKPRKR